MISRHHQCRFENTGRCRTKNCKNLHPKKTCQPFSKFGSCPTESKCENRHPYGVCYDWERYGRCASGDECRHKHPFEMAVRIHAAPNHFLGPRHVPRSARRNNL